MARLRRVPQQLRAERTRDRLLRSAGRVFANKGYRDATVDDISEGARCSKGAYYFHFASKEETFLALVDEWATRRRRELEARSSGDPPDAALAGVLDVLLSATDANCDGRLIVEFYAQAERNSAVRARLTRARRSWHQMLAGAFQRAQESGALRSDVDTETAASAALTFSDGLVLQTVLKLHDRRSVEEQTAVWLAHIGWSQVRAAGTAAPSRAAS